MRWLVLVGLVACGDNVVVDEPAISHGGDRLELYWNELDGARELASPSRFTFSTEDGFGQPIRMFDTARQEDCELIEWADGNLRCTPGVRRWESFIDVPVAVFADSGCTEVRGLSSNSGDYFLYGEWIEDRFLTSVVLVGTEPSAEQKEYYERRDGGCTGPVPTEGKLMWNVGGSVQSSELVAFNFTVLSTTEKVGHRAFVGADGTLVRDGFYDRALATPCRLVTGETDVRCVPTDEAASLERTFADASCSQPAVSNMTARFLHDVAELTGCPIVHELAEPRMMPVYELDGGQCIQTEVGMYRVGRPIEPPAVEVQVSDGAGRIVEVVAAGAPIGVFDTDIRASCTSRNPFDFGLGCHPSAFDQERTAFTDAACSRSVGVAMQPARICDRRVRFAHSRDADSYVEIGEPIDALFTLVDDVCVPLVPPDGYRFHQLGVTRVTYDELAQATLVHAR